MREPLAPLASPKKSPGVIVLRDAKEGPPYTSIDELPPMLESQIGAAGGRRQGWKVAVVVCLALAAAGAAATRRESGHGGASQAPVRLSAAAADPAPRPVDAAAVERQAIAMPDSAAPVAALDGAPEATAAAETAAPEAVAVVPEPSVSPLAPGVATAPQVPGPVEVHRTGQVTGERLARLEDVMWSRGPTPTEAAGAWFEVDARERRQHVLGFGGSFTEAGAHTWGRLSQPERDRVMQMLFAPPEQGGNGYTMSRTHINSCDFSTEHYNYVHDGDESLDSFNITRDRQVMIPFIKSAMSHMAPGGTEPAFPLRIVASPWSPPAWMKQPGPDGARQMEGSAVPMGLDSKYESVWAEYLSRYAAAYKAEGVPLWGMTPQNEPENPAAWESCSWDKKNMSRWIREHFGPVMRRDHPDLKLLGYDHNKDHLLDWAKEFYQADGGATAPFVDGMAFHWYRDCDGRGCIQQTAALGGADKLLLNSEACVCPMLPLDPAYDAERFARAEALAFTVMRDLEAGAHGWIDWNMLLDPNGGPSHTGANCESAIVGNPDGNVTGERIVPLPWYYFFGHFSRFVRPGGRVLKTSAGPGLEEPEAGGSALAVGNGLEVVLARCDHGSRQRWRLDLGDQCSHVRLAGGEPGQCFDLRDADLSDGAKVQTWKCDCQNTNQNWQLVNSETTPGQVMIKSRASGKCLAVPAAQPTKGAQLEAHACEDTAAQRWQYDAMAGELRTAMSNPEGAGWCVTAGNWELFRALAFQADAQGSRAALVVLNNGELPVSFMLRDAMSGYEAGPLTAPPHSATTYVYKLPQEVVV